MGRFEYFEFSDRSVSGEGGFIRTYLDHGDLVIVLAEALAKKYAFSSIRICGVQSTCDVKTLRESLHSVFDNTGCPFEDRSASVSMGRPVRPDRK